MPGGSRSAPTVPCVAQGVSQAPPPQENHTPAAVWPERLCQGVGAGELGQGPDVLTAVYVPDAPFTLSQFVL